MPDITSAATFTFVVSPETLKNFSPILQRGFFVKIITGCALEELLIEQLGIREEYIEKKISTIFLDGRPVDDLHAACVRDGSTLSLSAAMPGLVGASMRRKGVYASLRSAIDYSEKEDAAISQEGCIEVKLFNLVMVELGPLFLKRGIYVRSDNLAEFITSMAADFTAGCRLILLGDRPVLCDTAINVLKDTGPNLVRVFVIQHQDVVL